MSTQTEMKRKAAARKGQATKLRTQADKANGLGERITARAAAEREALTATSFGAIRVADAAIGGIREAGEAIGGAFRTIGDPAKLIRDARSDASETFERLERRGAQTRARLTRSARREAKSARGQARSAVSA